MSKPIADRRLHAARRRDPASVLIASNSRDACEDGRLADAILANEDGHGAIELELEALLKNDKLNGNVPRFSILDSSSTTRLRNGADSLGARGRGIGRSSDATKNMHHRA